MLVHFQKVSFVGDGLDQIANLVGLIRILGDEVVELRIDAVDVVGVRDARRIVEIVRRNERQQLADRGQAVFIGVGREVRDAGDLIVRLRAA